MSREEITRNEVEEAVQALLSSLDKTYGDCQDLMEVYHLIDLYNRILNPLGYSLYAKIHSCFIRFKTERIKS